MATRCEHGGFQQVQQAAVALQLLQALQDARARIEQQHLPTQIAQLAPYLASHSQRTSSSFQALSGRTSSSTSSAAKLLASALANTSSGAVAKSPLPPPSQTFQQPRNDLGALALMLLERQASSSQPLPSCQAPSSPPRSQVQHSLAVSQVFPELDSPSQSTASEASAPAEDLPSPRTSTAMTEADSDDNTATGPIQVPEQFVEQEIDWVDSILRPDVGCCSLEEALPASEYFGQYCGVLPKEHALTMPAQSMRGWQVSPGKGFTTQRSPKRKEMEISFSELPVRKRYRSEESVDEQPTASGEQRRQAPASKKARGISVNRADEIVNNLKALQKLVPSGITGEAAGVLDEAIAYVAFLKRRVVYLSSTRAAA